MPLPARTKGLTADYPKSVKESVSTLPFKAGGTFTLAVAGTRQNFVFLDDLRRFENDIIAAGTHTGAANQAVLTDANASFINAGVEIGDRINNTTDGSTTIITALTATTITGVLAGGGENDWDAADAYTIEALGSQLNARAEEIRKIRIATSLECYIKADGDARAGDHDFHLLAGESLSEDSVRIISRLCVVNVQVGQQPILRWWVWGA
jgi:hypothetical protein